MSKISFIGAGHVGGYAAACTAARNMVDNIVLLDANAGLAQGKGLDITQAMSLSNSHTIITGTDDYKDTANSEIVVVTAGIARKPGMSRDDLLETNAKIIQSVTQQVIKNSPDCILIIVTNPINTMVQLAQAACNIPSQKIIGMAGVLDSARFKTFIAEALNINVARVETMVLGDHGDLMVPLVDHCKVDGKPISQYLPADKIAAIVERVKHGGSEIVQLLKAGSAYYAPGMSIVEIVESIVKDQKKCLPCAVLLQGEYNTNGTFVGVPAIIGHNGVEKVIELDLNPLELAAFEKTVQHINKRNHDLLKKHQINNP